jgi:hypothetical protein
MVDTEMVEFVCNENEKDRRHMDAKGPEIQEAPVADATLARYAGFYDFEEDGKMHSIEITAAGGALYWDQDGTGKQRLLPFSETAFSLSGTAVEFVSSGGRTTHLVMKAAEGDTKAVRRK